MTYYALYFPYKCKLYILVKKFVYYVLHVIYNQEYIY